MLKNENTVCIVFCGKLVIMLLRIIRKGGADIWKNCRI